MTDLTITIDSPELNQSIIDMGFPDGLREITFECQIFYQPPEPVHGVREELDIEEIGKDGKVWRSIPPLVEQKLLEALEREREQSKLEAV